MSVGIIGTGAIGLPIAKRILSGGFSLNFSARKENVCNELCECGAKSFEDPESLGSECDTVFIFVNTFEQCEECVSKLLKTMCGGIIVIGATISPEQMEYLDKICREKSVKTIAAPVTGGVKGAIEGTLTIILSGNKNDVDAVSEYTKTFGKNLYFLGEKIGFAHTMKALVQLLVGINTVATAEALILGQKNGLEPQQIYDVISNSAGTSRIFENRACTMIKGDFSKRGTINILQKDLKISKKMAMDSNVPLVLGDVCSRLFNVGANVLDGEEDFSAIIKLLDGSVK